MQLSTKGGGRGRAVTARGTGTRAGQPEDPHSLLQLTTSEHASLLCKQLPHLPHCAMNWCDELAQLWNVHGTWKGLGWFSGKRAAVAPLHLAPLHLGRY